MTVYRTLQYTTIVFHVKYLHGILPAPGATFEWHRFPAVQCYGFFFSPPEVVLVYK